MKKCLFCFTEILTQQSLYKAFYLEQQYPFCESCAANIDVIVENLQHCPRCQRRSTNANICPDCRYWEQTAAIIVDQQAVFHYNAFIVDVLWKIKHDKDIQLIRGFYPAIRRYFQEHYDLANTLFIPIPTDEDSLKERRFHVSEFILRELKLPIFVCALFELLEGNRRKQHTLSARERRKTAQQKYNIDQAEFARLQLARIRNIVLIDDVYTTGATMIKAIQSLPVFQKEIKISSFTIFRS